MSDKRLFHTEVSTLRRIVASSIGGLITALVMTPLDVVKIRMQQAQRTLNSKCFVYCNGLMEHLCTCPSHLSSARIPWYRRSGNFTSTWVGLGARRHSNYSPSCVYHSRSASLGLLSHPMRMTDAFHQILRNEGILSLWSGLSPTLVMALPQTVIYFTLNDWLKDRVGYTSAEYYQGLHNHGSKVLSANDCTPAVVGGASRIIAVASISPLELLRTKMQASNMPTRQLLHLLSCTVKQDGVRSLWTGMGPMLLRDVPYSMIFWLFFDYLKSRYSVRQLSGLDLYSADFIQSKELPFCTALLYGASAGLIAGAFTHPFDVIKTHRQVELGESLVTGRAYPKSTWTSLRRLYASDGVRAMYSGLTPRLVKTTSASAIMIAAFEYFKGYFSD